MQVTTLRPKSALYTNGRYYVHAWKNERGTFSVLAAKKGLYRRSHVQWISSTAVATYEEACEHFALLRAQVDQIVSSAAAKRASKSTARLEAIAAYKASTPNPWKVGDLCHTSWGYDQTNVDAFQVVEVWSRTQISVRPIGGKVEETGWAQGKFTPVQNQFTGPAIKVIAGFSYWPHATSGTGVGESWAVKGHTLFETKPGQAHHFSSYA